MLLRKVVIITLYFTVFGLKTIIKVIRTAKLFLKIQSLNLRLSLISQKPLQQLLWNLAGFILLLLPSCKFHSDEKKNQKDKAIYIFHVLINGDQCFVFVIFPLDRQLFHSSLSGVSNKAEPYRETTFVVFFIHFERYNFY